MPSSASSTLLLLSITLPMAVSLSLPLATSSPATTVRAGYYLAAAARLRPLAKLDASLYTHLYYSALAVHPTTHKLVLPTDPAEAALLAAFSPALKSKNLALRTLLSVGTTAAIAGVSEVGATDPAFAAMASDPSSRAAFVAAAVALARDLGFDGLDLAWRFPSSAAEMAHLGFLLSDFRAATPPDFLLTATVYFSSHVLAGVDYPSEAMASCLDWVNVAAFGLRSPPVVTAGATTAFDAPLYDRATHFSASYGVVSWIDAGVPEGKVVMGVPLYGRSWFLRNKANHGVGAPVVAAGPKQRGSNVTGVMAYAEVAQLLLSGAGDGRSAVATAVAAYDNASVASYVAVGDVWVAFDAVAVVAEKLAFAARRGLLGYFLWPVNYDDANLTVSRTASEAWMQNEMSSSSKNGTGVRQTQEPVRLPPALRSPAGTPGPVPAPASGSVLWLPWTKLAAFLHLALLILVW